MMTEIRIAREVEKKEKRSKLFPIRLTDFETLRDWTCSSRRKEAQIIFDLRFSWSLLTSAATVQGFKSKEI